MGQAAPAKLKVSLKAIFYLIQVPENHKILFIKVKTYLIQLRKQKKKPFSNKYK